MTQYLNIDKSAFRKGEYVGYADGTWRIRRAAVGWRAQRMSRSLCDVIFAPTLGAISRKLNEYAAIAA